MGGLPGAPVTTLLLTPELLAGDEAAVEGDAYRHLFRARRLAVGDRLRVVDGVGAARWAEVVEVDRRRGRLRLLDPAPPGESDLRLELLVAAPRKERASWLVEKATELGVVAVRFLASERSPRSLGPGTRERLLRVAASALQQCGRSRLPEVTGVHPWSELPGLLEGIDDRWYLDTGAAPGTWGGVASAGGGGGAVLVGPEGGWTEGEAEELRSLGCRAVGLGERVLRVETAAIVAAAALLVLPVAGGTPRR